MKALYGFFLAFASTWTISVTQTEIFALCDANMQFAKDLYSTVEMHIENVLLSPVNLHIQLSMLLQGAQGNTAEALENTLRISKEVAFNEYYFVIRRLNFDKSENVTQDLSNNLYVMEGNTLSEHFNLVLHEFVSGVQFVDFSDHIEAELTINDWVSKQTHNKIRNVVSHNDFTPNSQLALINAVYFKGDWKKKFDINLTKKAPFYITPNESREVDMMEMHSTFRIKTFEDLEATVVELPYNGIRANLYILLPHARDGIWAMQDKLKDFDLNELFRGLSETEILLKMPRFRLNEAIHLEYSLKQMGLGIIYEKNEADLSGILTDGNLVVDKVFQRTFFEVDEGGAEAAGGNEAVGTTYESLSDLQIQIVANHPFMFWLINTQISTINDGPLIPVFCGKLTFNEML